VLVESRETVRFAHLCDMKGNHSDEEPNGSGIGHAETSAQTYKGIAELAGDSVTTSHEPK
jgi:hypothetical protein